MSGIGGWLTIPPRANGPEEFIVRKIENGFVASIPATGQQWYAPTTEVLMGLLRETILPGIGKPAKNIACEAADEVLCGLSEGFGVPKDKIKAAIRDSIEAQAESDLWRQKPDGDDDPTA